MKGHFPVPVGNAITNFIFFLLILAKNVYNHFNNDKLFLYDLSFLLKKKNYFYFIRNKQYDATYEFFFFFLSNFVALTIISIEKHIIVCNI